MSCGTCKNITKEQVMIGYYLCRLNSTEEVQYSVKTTAQACSDYKTKRIVKQEKTDEQKNK